MAPYIYAGPISSGNKEGGPREIKQLNVGDQVDLHSTIQAVVADDNALDVTYGGSESLARGQVLLSDEGEVKDVTVTQVINRSSQVVEKIENESVWGAYPTSHIAGEIVEQAKGYARTMPIVVWVRGQE